MAEQPTISRPTFDPAVPPGERPLSPHLQVWRWTVTMASSIAQRATGIGLYAGSVLLVAWLVSAAHSEGAYNAMQGFLTSPFGLFILFGFTWAQMYHMAKGILHLIWDSGHAIGKETATKATSLVFALSVALTALIWVVGFAIKGA